MKLSLKLKVAAIAFAFASTLIIVNPANAASSGTTTVNFTVVSGSVVGPAPTGTLTISAPSSLDLLDYVLPYTFLTAFPSAVTVTDTRSTSTGWISSVLMSPLSPASGATIPATVFAYSAGTITTISGGGSATGLTSVIPVASVNCVTAIGKLTASWIPTIQTTILDAPANGEYTGSITSSVL